MQRTSWRERGVTSVEYALMATIIALLLIGGVEDEHVGRHRKLPDRLLN